MHLFTQLLQILPSIKPSILHEILHQILPYILPYTLPCILHRILIRCLRNHASHQSLLPLAFTYATATSHLSTSHIHHSVNTSSHTVSNRAHHCSVGVILRGYWHQKTSTGKVDLLSFRPTPEELERAREMLASSDVKVKASKVRAMLHFAEGNPGDTANRILASRGDERLDYLARYIAFQDKKKKSKQQHQSQQRRRTRRSQRRRAHVRIPAAQRIWRRENRTHG